MILTIDVGNTNITCGVFQGDEIRRKFSSYDPKSHGHRMSMG